MLFPKQSLLFAPDSVELSPDVDLHPSFPAEEVERQRARRLGLILQRRDYTALTVAPQVASAALYGEKHPYGYPEIGTARRFVLQSHQPREAHGYTYGARSAFTYHRAPGPFSVETGVHTDVTALAVKEIFNELRRMREMEMTAEELTVARDSAMRSLPGRFESSFLAASNFAELYIYHLGLDYYTTLPARLAPVTAEQVQRVAQKYLAPEKMIVVSVGDRTKIEPELRKLGLGEVELRDPDGKLLNGRRESPAADGKPIR